jgi:hypothetical protein
MKFLSLLILVGVFLLSIISIDGTAFGFLAIKENPISNERSRRLNSMPTAVVNAASRGKNLFRGTRSKLTNSLHAFSNFVRDKTNRLRLVVTLLRRFYQKKYVNIGKSLGVVVIGEGIASFLARFFIFFSHSGIYLVRKLLSWSSSVGISEDFFLSHHDYDDYYFGKEKQLAQIKIESLKTLLSVSPAFLEKYENLFKKFVVDFYNFQFF